MTAKGSDNFYDADEGLTSDYDGSSNEQHMPAVDVQERLIQEQEWRAELTKLEEDIATLKTVLDAKMQEAAVLKRKLGITPMVEIKDDLKHGILAIKESGTYQKTNETLHQIGDTIATSDAYQKTNAALKSFGAFASKKFSEMRHSNVFKSVEEKVGDAYTNVKHSHSMGNIKTKLGSRMQTSRSAHNVCLDDDGVPEESYSAIEERRNSAGPD